MKTVRYSLLVTFCLVAAFFCGVYFEKSRSLAVTQDIPLPRVYLEQLKTKLNLRREGRVDIYLNGSKIQDDQILDLKK